MAGIDDIFTDFDGVTWLQPDGPNTEPNLILCVDADGPGEPQGDLTISLCRTGDRSWVTVNAAQGSPGEVTATITAWKKKHRSYLQKMVDRRIPFPLYINHSTEGRIDTFLNYEWGTVIPWAFITDKQGSNAAKGRSEPAGSPTNVEQAFSITAGPIAHEYYKLIGTVGDAGGEDEPLRDVAMYGKMKAPHVSGEYQERADLGSIAADAAAAAVADGYETSDHMASWTAWAAQPFAADEHICSVVGIQIDKDTTRIIVCRGTTDGANPAEIAYSDDDGATWTNVDVGATNGEFGLHSGALFALDARHIWMCTDLGNVYFSSDGGLTWTDQEAPTPGASEGLYYVHFADENYGWAVGGFPTTPTGFLICTTDGGEHWTAAASEPKVESAVWVSVIDKNKVWVGLDDGTIYYTVDWGTTWTQRTLPTTPTNTGDGRFIDDHCGFICGYYTSGGSDYAIIYRTVDGGHTWETYEYEDDDITVTYYGLNGMDVISYNEVIAVGEVLTTAATSIVWQLRPAGW